MTILNVTGVAQQAAQFAGILSAGQVLR